MAYYLIMLTPYHALLRDLVLGLVLQKKYCASIVCSASRAEYGLCDLPPKHPRYS